MSCFKIVSVKFPLGDQRESNLWYFRAAGIEPGSYHPKVILPVYYSRYIATLIYLRSIEKPWPVRSWLSALKVKIKRLKFVVWNWRRIAKCPRSAKKAAEDRRRPVLASQEFLKDSTLKSLPGFSAEDRGKEDIECRSNRGRNFPRS